ncbi:hypothetical protein D3C85_1256260 [compost metagenome]
MLLGNFWVDSIARVKLSCRVLHHAKIVLKVRLTFIIVWERISRLSLSISVNLKQACYAHVNFSVSHHVRVSKHTISCSRFRQNWIAKNHLSLEANSNVVVTLKGVFLDFAREILAVVLVQHLNPSKLVVKRLSTSL